MARDDPATRYPLPPNRDQRVPDVAPLDTEISELAGLWLRTECQCGRSSSLPLRLLAAQLGWRKTLGTIVPKLRCKECGSAPISVILVSDPSGDPKGGTGHIGPKLVLVGQPEGT